MLANICPSCGTGGVHNLPILTIFYPVAGKQTGTISHAALKHTQDKCVQIKEQVKLDWP